LSFIGIFIGSEFFSIQALDGEPIPLAGFLERILFFLPLLCSTATVLYLRPVELKTGWLRMIFFSNITAAMVQVNHIFFLEIPVMISWLAVVFSQIVTGVLFAVFHNLLLALKAEENPKGG
jgi:hypothetical protein